MENLNTSPGCAGFSAILGASTFDLQLCDDGAFIDSGADPLTINGIAWPVETINYATADLKLTGNRAHDWNNLTATFTDTLYSSFPAKIVQQFKRADSLGVSYRDPFGGIYFDRWRVQQNASPSFVRKIGNPGTYIKLFHGGTAGGPLYTLTSNNGNIIFSTPLTLELGSGSIRVSLPALPTYADDAAAGAVGGLSAGQLYKTNGTGAVPVAGVVMVKQ